MSRKYKKKYISAREFIDGWEKEIYELTKLDYFIYLKMNHLAHQLEHNFFINDRAGSRLHLDFENVGNLCFNLGDTFECYLDENCRKNNGRNAVGDIQAGMAYHEREDEHFSRPSITVRSFLADRARQEQRFRVELMDHVIFETLQQFYIEKLGMEFDEDDFEMIELADFIEDVIVKYIRHEGTSLLERADDPAVDDFERLLDMEDETDQPFNIPGEDDDAWDGDSEWTSEVSADTSIDSVVQQFIEKSEGDFPKIEVRLINIFTQYLREQTAVTDIFEINDEHVLEFLSVWLIRNLAEEDEQIVPLILHTMARFFNWLNQNYDLDHRRDFLHIYERVKTDVPRVVNALNTYIDRYDLLDVMIYRGDPTTNQTYGYYEIKQIDRSTGVADLLDIHFYDRIDEVALASAGHSNLKKGDILQANLIHKQGHWEILEIQYIYPAVSKPFVH